MKPTTPLILCAIAFGLLWSGWMVFLSGEFNTLVITAICGSIAAFLWYRIMSWCFRMARLLPKGAGASTAR